MSNAPPTTHRISEFHKWNKEKALIINPPFQRKPVWSDRNRTFLIDTILRGLPVPEIYIQVKTDTEGNTKYIVVDGQQRMRAVLDFIEGDLDLLADECPEYGGKDFTDLPSGVRRDFWDYALVTRELKTQSEDEIKSIFLRLNKYVVPLNPQELRNATYGGYLLKMVNEIAEQDDFWADNRIVRPNEIKRQLDAEFISELIIGMLNGIQQKDQEDIDGFYKKYDQTFSERDDVRKDFYATERLIQDIFGDDLAKTRWRGKPDFYSLFLAVYELAKVYHIPSERYDKMKKRLEEFAHEVDINIRASEKDREKSSSLVREYVEHVEKRSTHKSSRQERYDTVRELLIPFLIARDIRRNFNDEERRIAWNNSKHKICPLCHTEVTWENYNLDHAVPHSKGGKTELSNSQITHKVCNVKKSDKSL